MTESETVIRPGDRPVILINVFDVDRAAQHELVKLLEDATEKVMRHRPGFISANLHRSLDGTRVVNYAQWRSREDFEATMADPDAQKHMKRASELAHVTPHLYSAASVHHPRRDARAYFVSRLDCVPSLMSRTNRSQRPPRRHRLRRCRDGTGRRLRVANSTTPVPHRVRPW